MTGGANLVHLLYLVSAVLFILGIKRLSKVRTARSGNGVAALGMLLAIVGTLVEMGAVDYRWIIAGLVIGGTVGAVAALKVPMTSMPEMVALLNGFGGAASALVALAIYWTRVVEPSADGGAIGTFGLTESVTSAFATLIGGITLTGSLVAYGKLSERITGRPIILPARHVVNVALLLAAVGLVAFFAARAEVLPAGEFALLALAAVALVLGVLLVIPIGGADMPVVVSLLNSYSGVAAAAAGFALGNNMLIIAGSMVGAAGLILTRIMCVAMNRSLANVVLGGFGGEAAAGGKEEYENVRSAGAEEAAMVLEAAQRVVVVTGYGLAVAQAQHAARELSDLLEKRGIEVTYAIHPVAGRMPGHMNVLLAEADVHYDKLVEMERINPEFKTTDVVLVVGANDVVNPAALSNKSSPIYGMPILEVHQAKTVFVIKRSLGSGYAGVKNELFEYPNTMMIFGDAKKVLQSLVNELKELGQAA